MRTYFVWNMFEDGLKYGYVEYSATHLDETYINDSGTSDGEQDELNELREQATWCTDLPHWIEEIIASGNERYSIITTGMFP